ncbi:MULTISPECIES: hypothetical protein [unclassified Actinomadura]|uniref:hypothetical protein n=1 Tax=unclassified Actinomadura TaxID=2626254 RepID=UPI0011EE069D|nr:hypothetical protein [Actinomadura sp. K4S16]
MPAVLVVLLMVGCLMQLGKGAAVFRSPSASPVSAEAVVTGYAASGALGLPGDAVTTEHAAPESKDSGTEPGTGQCGKKTVAEAPSLAPAAQPLPVPAVMVPASLAETAAPPGAALAGAPPGPAPSPPDPAGLCVLRI